MNVRYLKSVFDQYAKVNDIGKGREIHQSPSPKMNTPDTTNPVAITGIVVSKHYLSPNSIEQGINKADAFAEGCRKRIPCEGMKPPSMTTSVATTWLAEKFTAVPTLRPTDMAWRN
ncbi:hypothetical protein FALBO_16871 [Fusarium albosuccineum]|uniref:Uncharacterized protein n=1 Tax=Fusarium albosuccineum TaxID=1237068 RepID=A0A8H4KCN2_9HYPO|nr:hypothetical protein FALBO_16871 [Fusarium albosuccineum]